MCKVYRFVLFFLLIISSFSIRANHILGGNFELNNTGTNGYFELKLNLFFDKARRAIQAADNNLKVAIYRKSDNKLMKSLTIASSQIQGTPLVYTNERCAAAQGLNIAIISFNENIYLDPALYDDPQGYYIVWDRCCRNEATNIANSLNTGMLFYLEFPPLLKAGTEFKNSSPKFVAPNGEYICRGQEFKFDDGAIDADGDQLRYSFVTPYSGFSGPGDPTPNPRGSSNFPIINWASGFDATTAIPSTPTMSIDANGTITVKSDKLGLYVFSVEVEELRNGVVIGRVRRDIQLKVIDCNAPPTTPVVFKDKVVPITIADPIPPKVVTLDICEYGFAELATVYNFEYQYQWQKDDNNIIDGDSYKLKVTEAGKYNVVISYKQGCSGSSISEKTTVSVKPGDQFEVSPDTVVECETPTGFALQVQKVGGGTFNAGNFLYLWTRDVNDTITVRNVFIQAKKTGKYNVRMTQLSGICQYDLKADVTINPLPEAILTNLTGKKVICEGDSIPIKASDSYKNTYEWFRDGISILKTTSSKFPVLKTGIYKVEITDGNTCKKMSDTLKLRVNPLTPVRFDTIYPSCGTGGNRIDLKPYVQPFDAVKGVFAGRGVSGTVYSPLLAGFGPSPITYTYTNEFGCDTKESRIAFVDLTPKVRLGNDITIFRGDTVTIKSTITGSYKNDLVVNWSPTAGLNSSTVGRPVASPSATTIYVLSAKSLSSDCTNQDTIVVIVKTKIQIPTGFTPNEDGINEAWVLEGIEDYPNAEVKIFNRWGGEMFSTKNYQNNPFNGKKDNSTLPMGTYYYVIKTGDDVPTLTGYVTLVRGGQ
jgi:gliding motility-associated-like protein